MPVAATYRDIEVLFENTGLVVRGGFATTPDDNVSGQSVVLIGNVGPEMWSAFAAARPEADHPLDTWTKSVVAPRAATLGCDVAYPNDKPYRPFQQWAMRAEPVKPSPLGILIHPVFGLWHAYRAALIFDCPVAGVPPLTDITSPCETCVDTPCLATCPVGAFDGRSYDVPTCVTHLSSTKGQPCHDEGCLARLACPIAPEHRTSPEQRAFHAAAFFKSNG